MKEGKTSGTRDNAIAAAAGRGADTSSEAMTHPAPEMPQADERSFDGDRTGFDLEVQCLGFGVYLYSYWFQHDFLEIVLQGDHVGINVRSLCEALGTSLEQQLPLLEPELGDDLYSPVGLPGTRMLVLVLAALPRFLHAIDGASVKDRAQLRCYQRHLFPSIWGDLPPDVTKRAARHREAPESRYCFGWQVAQELDAPSVSKLPHFEKWVVDDWPLAVSLPPMPVFRRDRRDRGAWLPLPMATCPAPPPPLASPLGVPPMAYPAPPVMPPTPANPTAAASSSVKGAGWEHARENLVATLAASGAILRLADVEDGAALKAAAGGLREYFTQRGVCFDGDNPVLPQLPPLSFHPEYLCGDALTMQAEAIEHVYEQVAADLRGLAWAIYVDPCCETDLTTGEQYEVLPLVARVRKDTFQVAWPWQNDWSEVPVPTGRLKRNIERAAGNLQGPHAIMLRGEKRSSRKAS